MVRFERVSVKQRIKWGTIVGLVLSCVSMLVLAFVAKSSSDVLHSLDTEFTVDINRVNDSAAHYRWRLWGNIRSLEPLHPFANPRGVSYIGPSDQNNGFIYAEIHGGFENIRNSICDIVTLSRLLNATLVLPDIQAISRLEGISSNVMSFSYLYDVEKFIATLASDVVIVRNLPPNFEEARRRKEYPIFQAKRSSSLNFYLEEILPRLKETKFIGLIVTDGGCLRSILPRSFGELQRLRCRVVFHALHFRKEISELAQLMVERLRGSGHPYIAYHPGLKRDTLAYHGCAEIFQDLHTELIQYRRGQMIKQGILKEDLSVDSHDRKSNGSCPLMPEEVGLLLQAIGYPSITRIYLAGSEVFGGQRVLIPLRAMYPFLVDRTSICSKKELSTVIGLESQLPIDGLEMPPIMIPKQVKSDWENAGPRPRPLPPPPDRPIYQHEREGWYGWIGEKDGEPKPSPKDLRDQAHHLLWDALDYIVSVEADAFFPGFDNDGSVWPDFSSLVKGHRLYKMASSRTYRPDRKFLAGSFNSTSDHRYHPPRNWTLAVKHHLNQSTGEDGVVRDLYESKPNLFLSYPLPECTCTTIKHADSKGNNLKKVYEEQAECPQELINLQKEGRRFHDSPFNDDDDEKEDDDDPESSKSHGASQLDLLFSEQDEEMDPDD